MKRSLIPAFVMLLAGTVTCILGVVYHYTVLRLLITLLIVLLSFYILGSIFKILLDKLIPLQKKEEQATEDEEQQEDGEDSQEDSENDTV